MLSSLGSDYQAQWSQIHGDVTQCQMLHLIHRNPATFSCWHTFTRRNISIRFRRCKNTFWKLKSCEYCSSKQNIYLFMVYKQYSNGHVKHLGHYRPAPSRDHFLQKNTQITKLQTTSYHITHYKQKYKIIGRPKRPPCMQIENWNYKPHCGWVSFILLSLPVQRIIFSIQHRILFPGD